MNDFHKLEQKVQKSIDILQQRALISRLLIGLSGGKDSLCLCELVKMAGIPNVKYFNMEFLPDLRIHRELLDYACIRFNIPYESIIKVPSDHFYGCMHTSAYTWYSESAKKLYPRVSRTQVFKNIAREHQGTIVTGVKKVDSMMMNRMLTQNKGVCIYPLAEWTLEDVFTFMELRHIDIPPLTKKGCRGVGLEGASLLFIAENYPDDFEKIEQYFPFCRAEILKYKYFNLKKTMRVI